MSLVQVIQDGNNEVTTGDNVFQIDELVDAYQVAPCFDLEENLIFHVIENIFVMLECMYIKRNSTCYFG